MSLVKFAYLVGANVVNLPAAGSLNHFDAPAELTVNHSAAARTVARLKNVIENHGVARSRNRRERRDDAGNGRLVPAGKLRQRAHGTLAIFSHEIVGAGIIVVGNRLVIINKSRCRLLSAVAALRRLGRVGNAHADIIDAVIRFSDGLPY